MTALITPACDVSLALRVNHDKTEAAVTQVKCSYYNTLLTLKVPQRCSKEGISF